jgi:SOS-response transcriptional repressor LexA
MRVQLSPHAFSFWVEGDSMIDPNNPQLSLQPGDTAIIEPEREPRPGSIVLARCGASVVVRKLCTLSDNTATLLPLNPTYAAQNVPLEHLLGVVAGFYRRL